MPEEQPPEHPGKTLIKPDHSGDVQNKGGDKSRLSIMGATTNPLNFFALVILIVESIMGTLVGVTSGMGKLPATEIPHMIYFMGSILIGVVGIVSVLACFRPEVLSPETSKMQRDLEEFRRATELAQKKADKVESLLADEVFREIVKDIVEDTLKQNHQRSRTKRGDTPRIPSHRATKEEEVD